MESVILAIFLIALYFVPTIIAVKRKKKNAASIGLLNFFLGFTFIGWVIALIWAVAED